LNFLGRHLIAEFYDCDSSALNDLEKIKKNMIESALIAGATVVNTSFNRFQPFGISGVVIISESHFTIHTWPEYGYAAVDLFTCGKKVDPWKAFSYLKEQLKANRVQVEEHYRGIYKKIGIPENSPHKISIKEEA
jgi:S-adenosylmethionine decarboxylase